MTQHALYVQFEAKPGKEQEVATFLSNARSMVNAATFRLNPRRIEPDEPSSGGEECRVRRLFVRLSD
jgi:hypothetical protein